MILFGWPQYIHLYIYWIISLPLYSHQKCQNRQRQHFYGRRTNKEWINLLFDSCSQIQNSAPHSSHSLIIPHLKLLFINKPLNYKLICTVRYSCIGVSVSYVPLRRDSLLLGKLELFMKFTEILNIKSINGYQAKAKIFKFLILIQDLYFYLSDYETVYQI